MALARGGERAHSLIISDPIHRWEPENRGVQRASVPWEALSRPLGPKDKILRKAVETCKQRRGEISKYPLPSHLMHCTNSTGHINERMIPEQYSYSL